MSAIGSDTIGGRIHAIRTELGLTLPDLAEQAGVSKSYLWNLENKPEHQRPSAQTLYAIAKVLGTTMSRLLGRELLNEPGQEVPESLRTYADIAALSDEDINMLASIRFRGGAPRTPERWRFIHQALKSSANLDR